MFELSVALKYLIPKKKQLSLTLIATMSVGVISLVVWLVLVFLSVTQGMERNWLKKLTDLNAPLKITPTNAYYSSYYYNIDSVAESSDYQSKTIGEKALASQSDPYNPEEDREIPYHWSPKDLADDGSLKDPVKVAYSLLNDLKKKNSIQEFQDFEMSGALLKLQLLRTDSPLFTIRGSESINFLSQVSYIASFPAHNPALHSLLLPPSAKDINHLLYLTSHQLEDNRSEGSPRIKYTGSVDFSKNIARVLENVHIASMKTAMPFWKVPHMLLPEGSEFTAIAYMKGKEVSQLVLSDLTKHISSSEILEGKIKKQNGKVFFNSGHSTYPLSSSHPIFSEEVLHFDVDLDANSLLSAERGRDLMLEVKTKLQGKSLEGMIAWEALEIEKCEAKTLFSTSPSVNPLWTYSIPKPSGGKLSALPSNEKDESGILLPKGFQDNGVLIGDRGYLSYNSTTASSLQEQRLPIYVAGFYDPGIMSVGNKCILASQSITRAINAANTAHTFDRISLNGIQVWLSDLSKAEDMKGEIQSAFTAAGIDKYWTVSSYKDYDFAKELLQQFQSDKYLFSLIAIIIITVACCNIISLLVLLVNDKKKEIGILLSMGASSKSIAFIFGTCGIVMGSLGCTIGCISAYLTMNHIDGLVNLLSSMQGHDAFSQAFYGSSLPNTLSSTAALFVMIATPLLALIAGLIPAIKACLLKPSSILRSE